MSSPSTFQIQSTLAASPAEVWQHISSMAGVNRELMPLLRMTYPAGLERLDQQTVPLGARLFRSYLLAFGVLPVDWDDLAFESITPGQGFVESSSLATARTWQHRRWYRAGRDERELPPRRPPHLDSTARRPRSCLAADRPAAVPPPSPSAGEDVRRSHQSADMTLDGA
jgi:hypothetical protein